jgi:hypothetical protein
MALVDYHEKYAPSRFPTAKKRRAQQVIAKRYRLKLIRIGNSVLIDEEVADDDLRKLALNQEPEARRRGRPRAVAR